MGVYLTPRYMVSAANWLRIVCCARGCVFNTEVHRGNTEVHRGFALSLSKGRFYNLQTGRELGDERTIRFQLFGESHESSSRRLIGYWGRWLLLLVIGRLNRSDYQGHNVG